MRPVCRTNCGMRNNCGRCPSVAWEDAAHAAPLPGMAPGLTALVTLVDGLGRRPIEGLSLDGIQANHAEVFPRGRVGQRLFEPLDPSVTISRSAARVRTGRRSGYASTGRWRGQLRLP